MSFVPKATDAQLAANRSSAGRSVDADVDAVGEDRHRETDLARMRALEGEPLIEADAQLFTVDGTYWIRHRGERRFHPATVLRLPRDGREEEEPIIEGPLAELLRAGDLGVRKFVPTPEEVSPKPRCPYLAGAGLATSGGSGLVSRDDHPPLHTSQKSWVDSVPDDQVIFHDPFEDGFPGTRWTAYDGDPAFGDDYWDAVDCHSHYGQRSVWCAGHGDQTSCSIRDMGMDSTMRTNPLVHIGAHSDVQLTYWSWQETDVIHITCNLTTLISEDGHNWVFGNLHWYDPSNVWIENTIDLSNFSTTGYLGVEFSYFNGATVLPNAGAYVDDFLVFGCPILGQTELVTPANGASICADEGLWWCWEPEPGASSYDVQWDETPAFLSPEQAQATGTCYYRSLPVGVYWWRAAPRSSCSAGIWSTPRQVFSIASPEIPSLTSPPDGAAVATGSPQTYTWQPAANATGYIIQWDDDPGFGSPAAQQTVAGTQATQTLVGSGQWYWRVRGDNVACDGSWSNPRTINLTGNPDLIFADDFESGNLSRWTESVP
jgi:hypothetical protein